MAMPSPAPAQENAYGPVFQWSTMRIIKMQYMRKCRICGKSFTTTNSLYIYCSPDCRADARRQRNREHMRESRAKASTERAQARADRDRERSAEVEERATKARADFERRCAEGDPHALMLLEKGQHGTLSRRYWELFAECSIDLAERAGTVSRLLVNGYSIYSDTFAEDVMESIRERKQIIIESKSKRRNSNRDTKK